MKPIKENKYQEALNIIKREGVSNTGLSVEENDEEEVATMQDLIDNYTKLEKAIKLLGFDDIDYFCKCAKLESGNKNGK